MEVTVIIDNKEYFIVDRYLAIHCKKYNLIIWDASKIRKSCDKYIQSSSYRISVTFDKLEYKGKTINGIFYEVNEARCLEGELKINSISKNFENFHELYYDIHEPILLSTDDHKEYVKWKLTF